MSTTAVGHCEQCAAVVNSHWPTCLVCHALIPSSREPGRNASASLPQLQREDATACSAPLPPLHPGWLVAYRDRLGVLCGGCDDRAHGTVAVCLWERTTWTVMLTNGQRLPLPAIRSVGQIDAAGQLVTAWTVKEHGVDGNGTILK